MDITISQDLKTTSRIVAEVYGKLHKNVLRQIDNLVRDLGGESDEFVRLSFEPSTFNDLHMGVISNRVKPRPSGRGYKRLLLPLMKSHPSSGFLP